MDKNSILAYYFRQECSMYFNIYIYIIAKYIIKYSPRLELYMSN